MEASPSCAVVPQVVVQERLPERGWLHCQAALGDPLVPYEARVENGAARIIASQPWTRKQKQWLNRIAHALKAQPVGDPELLADPLFAQAGGFETIDRKFDHHLADVLKDLNTAIWDSHAA